MCCRPSQSLVDNLVAHKFWPIDMIFLQATSVGLRMIYQGLSVIKGWQTVFSYLCSRITSQHSRIVPSTASLSFFLFLLRKLRGLSTSPSVRCEWWYIQSTQTVRKFFTCNSISALPNFSPIPAISMSPNLSSNSIRGLADAIRREPYSNVW